MYGSCAEYVDTPYGKLFVSVEGDRNLPAVLTYHDVGLNHHSTFKMFLVDPNVEPLTRQFCWYHINAPGQEYISGKLPYGYAYPSMTQLAEQIEYIAEHFQLAFFCAIGVGAGADVLARYAIIKPGRVNGLILINLQPRALSWNSLAKLTGKAVSWQLKGRDNGITRLTVYHLSRQTFGPSSPDIDQDLVYGYVQNIAARNPHNLALFLESYNGRSSLAGDFARSIECKCLFIVSSNFEQKEEVVKLCSMLDTEKATFLELSNTSGTVLDDQPQKVCIALRLFLQGLGLAPSLSSAHFPPANKEECAALGLRGQSARLYLRTTHSH